MPNPNDEKLIRQLWGVLGTPTQPQPPPLGTPTQPQPQQQRLFDWLESQERGALGGVDPRTQPPLPPQGPLAAPSIASSRYWEGLRDPVSPDARQAFERHVGHDPRTWLKDYLGGEYYSPGLTRFNVTNWDPGYNYNSPEDIGPQFSFKTRLVHPTTREPIGDLERTFWPKKGIAKHDFFELDEKHQDKGIGRRIINRQIDAYRKMASPINKVKLLASLDWGGYNWAKRGFVPTKGEIEELEDKLWRRAHNLKRRTDISHNQLGEMLGSLDKFLGKNDQFAVHHIVNHPPFKEEIGGQTMYGQMARHSIAKHLLRDQTYRAILDLDNPRQMEQFDRTRGID